VVDKTTGKLKANSFIWYEVLHAAPTRFVRI